MGDTVPSGFVRQLAKLWRGGWFPLSEAQGCFIDRNRNEVIKKALDLEGWEMLLFVDPDMVLPEDVRERVEAWDMPVTGGIYFRRIFPNYAPVPGRFAEPENSPLYNPLSPDDLLPKLDAPGVYRMHVVGTGLMGIRRDVLEHWPQDKMPWFAEMISRDGIDMVGEDVHFCWRCWQQHIPVYLDTRVCLGHRAEITVGVDSYRRIAERQAES